MHFDISVVMQVLKATITEKRTNQNFILLEGVCNNQKLEDIEDQLELRFMDELFGIENIIGEVAAVISLQYKVEQELLIEDHVQYEKFPTPPQVQEKAKTGDEDEEEEEPPAEEEGEEPKEPVFKPENFKWTVSNRNPKNLPQLFMLKKGISA